MEGYVYAVGGYDSSCQLSSVERYCTATNQWEFVAPMRSPRSALSVAVINNRLYALGECNIAAAILTFESRILKILFLVFNDEFADVFLLSIHRWLRRTRISVYSGVLRSGHKRVVGSDQHDVRQKWSWGGSGGRTLPLLTQLLVPCSTVQPPTHPPCDRNCSNPA